MLSYRRFLEHSRANSLKKNADAVNIVSPTPQVMDPPQILHTPIQIEPPEQTNQQGAKKTGEPKSSRVQIIHLEDNHDRLVRLNVRVTDESSKIILNQDCTALGITRNGTLICFYIDAADELRILTAEKKLISSSIYAAIKVKAVKPLKKIKVPRTQFEDDDFLSCSVLRTPGGTPDSGNFLVTKGPLFGKVCDEDLKLSIINSMSYFHQSCNNSSKIIWTTEKLTPKACSNLTLSHCSVLSATRGITRASNLDVLHQLNLPGATISIGNRPISFPTEKKLDFRLLQPDESVEEPLAVLRYILGCDIEPKIGEFIYCSNQVLFKAPTYLMFIFIYPCLLIFFINNCSLIPISPPPPRATSSLLNSNPFVDMKSK